MRSIFVRVERGAKGRRAFAASRLSAGLDMPTLKRACMTKLAGLLLCTHWLCSRVVERNCQRQNQQLPPPSEKSLRGPLAPLHVWTMLPSDEPESQRNKTLGIRTRMQKKLYQLKSAPFFLLMSNAELTGRRRVDALPARRRIGRERLAGKVASRWRSG